MHYSDEYQIPSSDSYSDGSQTAAGSDDASVLADHLANNYGLDNNSRGELLAFSQASLLTRSLPGVQSQVVLIQHAATLQNGQAIERLLNMCMTIQSTVDSLVKSTLSTEKFTVEQKAEINAACRAVFFTGRLTNFDNDDLKPEVVVYLKKHMDTNGFKLFFEDKTQAHSRVLFVQVGRSLSGIKSFFRRATLKSLPDGKGDVGCSITALANTLGKRCLGGIENVKPKHAIWLLIVRSFIRNDEELQMFYADLDDNEGDENGEIPTPALPAKRTRNGTVKVPTSDGKIITTYWERLQFLFKQKNKEFGTTELKSEPWTRYINTCVVQEKALFPHDNLALIVGNQAVISPPAPPSLNRLAALPMPNEAGGSRPTLGSRPSHAAAASGSRASLDHLINTPTPFTIHGTPLNAGFSLPPLNLRGNNDVVGSRYQNGH
ncbi:hypothetical protein MSAN_00712800 [Mycena sanguinolenta]|uniref:Uncharacterized protein n=1 Tax=Mycena sanguinolenta TaxID=230812 RepID=A0A8H6Z212_9AGAR|nr:hypothetical protein MSAN_00712800 [Mycena sanguinolenta]